MKNLLAHALETARQSSAYHNYLDVRERVLAMLDEASRRGDQPSYYWQEELAGFDYMLDASPLIVAKLREHCYHLTGLRSYDYRRHHEHKRSPFARKLENLRERDSDNLFVPEPVLLGGFGHEIDGGLVNLDTLKFYESLIALNKAGLLRHFRQGNGKEKVVLEIGAGWGGFAYQFKTLCPSVCYLIVDLPQTLLFAGVYLKTLFPDSAVLFYGDKPTNTLLLDWHSYDFIFLPNFFFEEAHLPSIDLAINIASFQEMTSGQVESYVRGLAMAGCSHLYSHNRNRSPHNSQLSSVSDIIREHYDLTEITVLDQPYNDLSSPAASISGVAEPAGAIRQLLRKLLIGRRTAAAQSTLDYRHLVGVRRGSDGG